MRKKRDRFWLCVNEVVTCNADGSLRVSMNFKSSSSRSVRRRFSFEQLFGGSWDQDIIISHNMEESILSADEELKNPGNPNNIGCVYDRKTMALTLSVPADSPLLRLPKGIFGRRSEVESCLPDAWKQHCFRGHVVVKKIIEQTDFLGWGRI